MSSLDAIPSRYSVQRRKWRSVTSVWLLCVCVCCYWEVEFGFTYLCCHSCPPSLSCVSSTWARRGPQTSPGGQEPCTSLCCKTHTHKRSAQILRPRLRTSVLFFLEPPWQLVTFVFVCIPHKERRWRNTCRRCQSAAWRGGRGADQSRLHFRDCGWKKKKEEKPWGDLLVIVDEKALHNEDMDAFLLRVSLIILGRQADAMGAGELDRVLLPSSHRVGHGLHVQGVDHWCGTERRRRRRREREREDQVSPHKRPQRLKMHKASHISQKKV